MMKVLYLPSWYPPDGGSFFVNQIESLSKKGIDCSVIYSRNILRNVITNPFELQKLFEVNNSVENGFEVYRNSYIAIPGCRNITLNIYSLACERLFKECFSRNGFPDLIHVHSCLWGGYVAKYLSEKYGIPYIITEHRGRFTLLNDLAKSQVEDSYTPILSEVFNKSSGVILVGGHLYNGLSKYYDKTDVLTEIIPNGIYTDYFTPVYDTKKKQFIFVTVTSLIKLKGIDWLINSFAVALERIKSRDVVLNIVGDGPERKSLEDLAITLGIKNNVIFHGRLTPEGVKEHLQKADAFIFPSRFEAQGVSYIEALSTGLPAICSTAVPIEVFRDFVGYRIEIDNNEELSKAICNMVINYNGFDREKIRNYAVNEYDFEKIAEKIINFYLKVLE